MSGGPAPSAGNPKKISSQFSPAFLKAGRGGGAERRQWRKKRGGSPVSKGVEGSRLGGDAQRPLRTAGAERRQWRKKRGGSPVSKGVEGSRLGGDAQRPLGTACGGLAAPHTAPPTGPGAEPRAHLTLPRPRTNRWSPGRRRLGWRGRAWRAAGGNCARRQLRPR